MTKQVYRADLNCRQTNKIIGDSKFKTQKLRSTKVLYHDICGGLFLVYGLAL